MGHSNPFLGEGQSFLEKGLPAPMTIMWLVNPVSLLGLWPLSPQEAQWNQQRKYRGTGFWHGTVSP
jgi:hypothetical protein